MPKLSMAPAPAAGTVTELLAGLDSPRAGVRFASSKALRLMSAGSPELLYPHFDRFAHLLGGDNQILAWNASLTLANLARVDREGKVEAILAAYLRPIRGPHLITAANAIRGAAAIASAKPHLAGEIARRILAVEGATYATPECRNVAIGHALTALGEIGPALPDPSAVRRLAARQTANPRPATRRKAEQLARRFTKSGYILGA